MSAAFLIDFPIPLATEGWLSLHGRSSLRVKCFYVIIAAYELQLKNVAEYLEKYLKENDSAWKFPKDFFIISEQKQLKRFEEQALELASIDFMNMEKTLRNCIPHIRFFQMSPENYKLFQDKFKNILPIELDEEIMQHFKEYNPLVKPSSNKNILPPRSSVYQFDSNIINAKDAALIASWIDGIDNGNNRKLKKRYQFKNIPFKFDCIYRGSIDGFDNYYYEKNLFKYNRIVVLIKVRDSEEIIGVYNPFGWGINYGLYLRFKLFKDVISQYFIFSLTNRANPILSYHKKGIMSKISNDGCILFGDSDLSINGSYCTSKQHSYKKKIIDKESFEMAELEFNYIFGY
ncbi:12872_t:CDS:2 [Rhizophagus irregularis]|nr:12872_t:CDS:2 [Rhizophagus irregularis]